MKERPILFNSEMVRAVLDGRKTQTRRVVKQQPKTELHYEGSDGPHVGMILSEQPFEWGEDKFWRYGASWGAQPDMKQPFPFCPYGVPGDRLYLREVWCSPSIHGNDLLVDRQHHPSIWKDVIYRADSGKTTFDVGRSWTQRDSEYKWRSPVTMPKWASRLTLEVVSVRVERVQEISEADAKDEGIKTHSSPACITPYKNYLDDGRMNFSYAPASFASLWDSINAKRGYGWDANPWCWVVEFKRVEG